MHRLLMAALALSLLGGAAAKAQPHGEHGPGGPGRSAPHGPPPAPPRPAPAFHPAPGGGPQVSHGGAPPFGLQPRPQYQAAQPSVQGRPQAYGGPAPRYFPRGPGGAREWYAGQRFRGPAYYFPAGFGYRVWSFGEFLPPPFFVSDYVLYDYWDYGLPAPPAGFEWVRVGADALLVRPVDGYILDVARNLFW